MTGSLDLEEELNQFLRSHRVISVQKTVATTESIALWCFCVEFLDGNASIAGRTSTSSSRTKKVDYKELLSEEDFAIYAKLRDIRKALAAEEAVPVYAICTNELLSKIAINHPVTLAGLKNRWSWRS